MDRVPGKDASGTGTVVRRTDSVTSQQEIERYQDMRWIVGPVAAAMAAVMGTSAMAAASSVPRRAAAGTESCPVGDLSSASPPPGAPSAHAAPDLPSLTVALT